jgi:hypothetical protein
LQKDVGRDKLLVLAYHDLSSFFGTSAGQQRYFNYYGRLSRPLVVFDGVELVLNGSTNPNDSRIDAQYRLAYSRRASIPSPVRITVTGAINTQATPRRATVTATIEALNQLAGALKARFVLYEDKLNYRAPNGETRFNWVVRAVLEEGTLTITQPAQSMMFNRAVDLNPPWVTQNLGMAVFVQNDSTKEVLGAADFRFPAPIP